MAPESGSEATISCSPGGAREAEVGQEELSHLGHLWARPGASVLLPGGED